MSTSNASTTAVKHVVSSRVIKVGETLLMDHMHIVTLLMVFPTVNRIIVGHGRDHKEIPPSMCNVKFIEKGGQ